MIDLEEINAEILSLENKKLDYAVCSHLADMVILKNFYSSGESENDVVVKEYDDILPKYIKYKDVKRLYQLDKTTEKEMLKSLSSACDEIYEFINTIFINTGSQSERDIIVLMIQRLSKI